MESRTRTKKKKNFRGVARYSSRLTSKYQATIPREIRDHLHLESGDQVYYERLPDDTVTIRKISPLDLDYLQALDSTMNEWKSIEDEQAYKNL